MHTILIVDDEPNYLVVLSELLSEEGFEVFTANSGDNGLKIAQVTDLDLVLTDMRMPGMDGLELLKTLKTIDHDLPVIMITAFGEVDMAVAAMQAGAFTYLTKPFNNDELVLNIRTAVEYYSLIKENRRLRAAMRSGHGFANMVGTNPKMQQVFRLIEKVAPTPSAVLITGESGTGKELVAKAVHFNSPRDQGPFISINCAALPESLLESELFGHEKGAFTGAIALRKGRFELAHNGTLFLDEAGDMPLSLQPKLLRVLQEKTIERVGGTKTIKVDTRIVAATNKNLKQEVDAGNFREDLYYRLNVLPIHLPPLRERIDDIPPLVAHFITKYSQELNRPNLKIDPEALRYLTAQPWAGNVRELENRINRACILCTNDYIAKHDVLTDEAGPRKPVTTTGLDLGTLLGQNARLPDVLDTIEEEMIRKALARADFVQAHAADNLGITKSLLQYKMKKYRIDKKG